MRFGLSIHPTVPSARPKNLAIVLIDAPSPRMATMHALLATATCARRSRLITASGSAPILRHVAITTLLASVGSIANHLSRFRMRWLIRSLEPMLSPRNAPPSTSAIWPSPFSLVQPSSSPSGGGTGRTGGDAIDGTRSHPSPARALARESYSRTRVLLR